MSAQIHKSDERRPSSSPYRCGFCREWLVATSLDAFGFLRLLCLMRSYQCPHCFQCVDRPVSWIGRLPVIGRIFRTRGLRDLYRQIESSISAGTRRVWNMLAAGVHFIWRIVWYLPSLLLYAVGVRSRRFRRLP